MTQFLAHRNHQRYLTNVLPFMVARPSVVTSSSPPPVTLTSPPSWRVSSSVDIRLTKSTSSSALWTWQRVRRRNSWADGTDVVSCNKITNNNNNKLYLYTLSREETLFKGVYRVHLFKPDVPRRLALSNFEHLVSLSSEHTDRQTDSWKHCMDRSLNCDHVFVGSDRRLNVFMSTILVDFRNIFV